MFAGIELPEDVSFSSDESVWSIYLIKATKGQEEMVAAVFSALNDVAASNNAALPSAAKDGL